jgi:hypothetical protein
MDYEGTWIHTKHYCLKRIHTKGKEFSNHQKNRNVRRKRGEKHLQDTRSKHGAG